MLKLKALVFDHRVTFTWLLYFLLVWYINYPSHNAQCSMGWSGISMVPLLLLQISFGKHIHTHSYSHTHTHTHTYTHTHAHAHTHTEKKKNRDRHTNSYYAPWVLFRSIRKVFSTYPCKHAQTYNVSKCEKERTDHLHLYPQTLCVCLVGTGDPARPTLTAVCQFSGTKISSDYTVKSFIPQ